MWFYVQVSMCVCTDSCSCAAGRWRSRVLFGPSCKRPQACPPQMMMMMMWSPWKCLAIVQSSREKLSIKTLWQVGVWGFSPSWDVSSIPEFVSTVYIQLNQWMLKWWETDQPIKRHRLLWLVSFFVTVVSKATNWCTGSLSLWSKNIKDVISFFCGVNYRYRSLILHIYYFPL